MFDITGRKIDAFAFSGDGVLTINTSNYSKGVYICMLYIGNEPVDQVKLAIIK